MNTSEPLPEVDRADELKRHSMALIGAAVPKDRFIHREESQDDKGVDLHLEALLDRKATRFCSNVQVKATDSQRLNADQSFSLQIAVKNFNYLLNGSCPLYVVWLAARNELRYAWARDEAKRLHKENPDWGQQETVSLHFSKMLDTSAWDEIHTRIVKEGSFARAQHDSLTRAGTTKGVVIWINTETLETTDPTKALEMVSEYGIFIVSNGYPLAIHHYARFLTHDQLSAPAVQLALGFACYHLGEHFQARGHLGRAYSQRQKLPEFDRYFLDTLLNECNLRFGIIDEQSYVEAQRHIEREAPDFLALQIRLELLRWRHMGEHDTPKRVFLLKQLRDTVAQLQQSQGATESLKLQSDLIRLYAEMSESHIGYMSAVIRMRMRAALGQFPFTPDTKKVFADAMAVESKIGSDVLALIERAQKLQHPQLIAEANLTYCLFLIGQVTLKRTIVLSVSGERKDIPAEIVNDIAKRVQHSIAFFTHVGSTENVVRSNIILAQWYSLNNQQDRAKELVDSVMGTARGMGYTHLVQQGEDIITCTTELHRCDDALLQKPDLDYEAAANTDEEVSEYAEFLLASAELPESQLPVLRRMALVMREESRTRVRWCSHFHYTVDRDHSRITPTSHDTDPTWFARCSRFGFRTYNGSTDAADVTARFKNTYCSVCSDRCPKANTSPTAGSR